MTRTVSGVDHLLADAVERGQELLSESDGLALLAELGIRRPHHFVLDDSDLDALLQLDAIPGDRVVLKIMSPQVAHKSDRGGVIIVDKTKDAIRDGEATLRERFADVPVDGVFVAEYIPYDPGFGNEFLVGLRWTDDFGPVLAIGPGGIHAELISKSFRPECGTIVARADQMADTAAIATEVAYGAVSGIAAGAGAETRAETGVGAGVGAGVGTEVGTEVGAGAASMRRDAATTPNVGAPAIAYAIHASSMVRLATEPQRGRAPRLAREDLWDTLRRLGEARHWMPSPIREMEINPLVIGPNGLVALDVLVRLNPAKPKRSSPPRPLQKIGNLLEPQSIAVAGVSGTARNPGRVIVQNVLGRGFDPGRLHIVKPGDNEPIEGCRCYPSFSSLPEPVDLAVLSLSAKQIPDTLDEIVNQDLAQSLIVIPGGLEEKPGAESLVGRIQGTLRRSRERESGGPVMNGGNCLGVRSHPGKYDTLFIPAEKMPPARPNAAPVALVCQSGAHLVATLERIGHLDPRFAISVGNQTDLTIGDYMTALADDSEVKLFAVYVEGLRPLDGQGFLDAVTRIRQRGGHVVVYRAGRTEAGADASASHTASIAGDYQVLKSLATQAGALVADSFDDFSDLIELYVGFDGRMPKGGRLAAMSNAGFECVAIADNLGAMTLADLTAETREEMQNLLDENRLAGIVSVHHPWDVTPMMGDAPFAAAAHTLIADANVDLGLIGCVPLTPALQTQEPEGGWSEDLTGRTDIIARFVQLWESSTKPWVVVVEGGEGYDPMARALQRAGVPTFRSVDRAMKALQLLLRDQGIS